VAKGLIMSGKKIALALAGIVIIALFKFRRREKRPS
jgi:hypothetical protein